MRRELSRTTMAALGAALALVTIAGCTAVPDAATPSMASTVSGVPSPVSPVTPSESPSAPAAADPSTTPAQLVLHPAGLVELAQDGTQLAEVAWTDPNGLASLLTQIFGAPKKTTTTGGSQAGVPNVEIEWGGITLDEGLSQSSKKVAWVSVTVASLEGIGFATPSGAAVGMDLAEIATRTGDTGIDAEGGCWAGKTPPNPTTGSDRFIDTTEHYEGTPASANIQVSTKAGVATAIESTPFGIGC